MISAQGAATSVLHRILSWERSLLGLSLVTLRADWNPFPKEGSILIILYLADLHLWKTWGLNSFSREFSFHFFILFIYFFSFSFISWRLINLQFIVVFVIHWHESAMDLHVFPIPIPPSHLPLHPIPLGLPSAPALSTRLMHPTLAGDLFHPR